MHGIPKLLYINDKIWRVRRKPLRFQHGKCNHRKREITLDSESPASEQRETFLHELMHACWGETWSAAREERMVRKLSPRLFEVLKDIGWAP